MYNLIKLLTVSAAVLIGSAAFAGECDKDLLADQSQLQKYADLLKIEYPYTEYNAKTAREYESAAARLSENKRLIWLDMIEASNTLKVIQRLISGNASGTTRSGYEYSVSGGVLSLKKGDSEFSVTLESDFGPGFSIRNLRGGELRYSNRSLVEQVASGKITNRLDLFMKLQRFGLPYFGQSEVDAALDLVLSVQSLNPSLPHISFASIEDFSAALDRYYLNGYYGMLPLADLPAKIARLRLKASSKDLVIGDYDYSVKIVSAKQLKKFGETGDWLSINDEDRQYWIKNPGRGENLRIRSFKVGSRSLKPMGSLMLKRGKVYPSSDWIPENQRVVFALLMIFRDTGLE